ncbi:hypothetical protein V6574_26970 [Streptomyces sp. SM1P]
MLTAGNRAYVHGEFALFDAAGAALSDVQLPASFENSGNRVATMIPEGTLVPGRAYRWAMRACDDSACSPWTAKRTFTAKTPVSPPVPQARTTTLSGSALRDATAPVGAADCDGTPARPSRTAPCASGPPAAPPGAAGSTPICRPSRPAPGSPTPG